MFQTHALLSKSMMWYIGPQCGISATVWHISPPYCISVLNMRHQPLIWYVSPHYTISAPNMPYQPPLSHIGPLYDILAQLAVPSTCYSCHHQHLSPINLAMSVAARCMWRNAIPSPSHLLPRIWPGSINQGLIDNVNGSPIKRRAQCSQVWRD